MMKCIRRNKVRMGKFQSAKIEQRLEITAAAKFKIIHKSMLRICIMYMCASTVLSTCTSIVLV